MIVREMMADRSHLTGVLILFLLSPTFPGDCT
jgi:hypothetical protein